MTLYPTSRGGARVNLTQQQEQQAQQIAQKSRESGSFKRLGEDEAVLTRARFLYAEAGRKFGENLKDQLVRQIEQREGASIGGLREKSIGELYKEAELKNPQGLAIPISQASRQQPRQPPLINTNGQLIERGGILQQNQPVRTSKELITGIQGAVKQAQSSYRVIPEDKRSFYWRRKEALEGIGVPSVVSPVIAGIDTGTQKFSNLIVSPTLDKLGISEGSFLRKKTSFSVGEFAVLLAFSPLIETGAGAKQKAKVVTKSKKEITAKDLRKALEKLSEEEQDEAIKQAKVKVDKTSLSSAEKEALKTNLDVIRLEAKTKTKILTESGAIDINAYNKALEKLKPTTKQATTEFNILVDRPPQLKGSGSGTATITSTKDNLFLDTKNLPSYVGGQGQGSSLFVGSGQYEKTQLNINPLSATRTGQQTKTNTLQIPLLASSQGLGIDSATAQKTNTQQRQEQRTQQRVLTTPALSTATQQDFIQLNKLGQGTRQTPRPRQPQRPKTPKQPRTPFLTSSEGRGKIQKIIEDNFGGFEAFGKRFGKDISLGTFKSKTKAESVLSNFLKGTLARSGFISKGGQKVKSDLLRSPIFRPSKKDKFRVVQKAKYSLGSPSEVSEINYFKNRSKKKTKKSKGLNWLA